MALLLAGQKRLVGGLFLIVLLAVVVGVWLERKPLLTWYALRGLAKAGEDEREVWVDRVAEQGKLALPTLLEWLGRDDERICSHARAALARICGQMPQDDLHWTEWTDRLATQFPHLSEPGQRCVLTLAAEWVRPAAQPSAATLECGVSLLALATQTSDPIARTAALDVAAALLAQHKCDATVGSCRELARTCLKDGDAAIRSRAVHLALYPMLNLLEDVAPLVRDSSVEVRRAVVLAVGASRQAISDENLALALHDPDAEVRRLCEKALRGRGLTQRHIRLARLITDGRPGTRLQVLYYLQEDSDLDVVLWLRLLTQDPAETVRLAAIRAVVEQEVLDLDERLEQMAKSDPSPTVCQWARYYLSCLKQHEAKEGSP
jgi:HEAT repeat protein